MGRLKHNFTPQILCALTSYSQTVPELAVLSVTKLVSVAISQNACMNVCDVCMSMWLFFTSILKKKFSWIIIIFVCNNDLLCIILCFSNNIAVKMDEI